MKYHALFEISLFLSKMRKDVAKFVFCCSHDWRFKGQIKIILWPFPTPGEIGHSNSKTSDQRASHCMSQWGYSHFFLH